MKTPMQKYILELRKRRNIAMYGKNTEAAQAYNISLLIAERYLQMERTAIESACTWGFVCKNQYKSVITSGEQYFNERYNEDIYS
jgi:hypothetical protein